MSCTHVCAVLYYWLLFKQDNFCPTSNSNTWKVPTTRILGKRTSEVQFRKIKVNKLSRDDCYYKEANDFFDPRSNEFRNSNLEKKNLLENLILNIQINCPDSLFLNFHGKTFVIFSKRYECMFDPTSVFY